MKQLEENGVFRLLYFFFSQNLTFVVLTKWPYNCITL